MAENDGKPKNTLAIFNELQNRNVSLNEEKIFDDESGMDIHDRCLVKMVKIGNDIRTGGLKTDKDKLSAMYDLIEISSTCYRAFDRILNSK